MNRVLAVDSDIESYIHKTIRLISDDSHIVETRPSLNYASLLRLCKGEILALRIPGFLKPSECEQILSNLDKNDIQPDKYDNAPELNLYRLGMSYFETRFNPALLDRYFSSSIQFPQIFHHLCHPATNPIEQLITEFAGIWPGGVAQQMLDNKPMMPGLLRILRENQAFPPHQDLLNRDCPHLPSTEHPLSQLAANFYLQNFDQGGELEIWDFSPDDAQVRALYTGTHDFIDRDKIPVNGYQIKPRPGELILIQSGKLHAVKAGRGGRRVAFSCFTAYRGPERPLTYWV